MPGNNDEVIIDFPVLLDTPTPELFSIKIQNGGRLVWSSDGDYSLRLKHIQIKSGGEMHIGSEDCQFVRKAKITLLGEQLPLVILMNLINPVWKLLSLDLIHIYLTSLLCKSIFNLRLES